MNAMIQNAPNIMQNTLGSLQASRSGIAHELAELVNTE